MADADAVEDEISARYDPAAQRVAALLCCEFANGGNGVVIRRVDRMRGAELTRKLELLIVKVYGDDRLRRAQRSDGFWAINVAQDGEYKIDLRRWPRELNQPITAGVPHGRALEVTEARLKVADFDQSKPIDQGATAASFAVPLKSGPTRLQAWFTNTADDGQTFGVYYVDVTRLP